MVRRYFNSSSPFRPSPLSMIFSYIILGIWSLFVLFAIYWLVITAFKTPADVDNGARYLPFVDYKPTLDAWQYILYSNGDPTFALRPYVNSIVVGILSSVFALILGASTSYALTRFTYRPK